MSVLWIDGQRFAAGLEWQRGLVAGRRARRLARQRRRPWAVNVAGQTGFADDAGEPRGVKPLAGAIAGFLRTMPDRIENWIAFIGEDAGEGGEPGEGRVAAIRCHSGSLLADGDMVFASAEAALEALGEGAVANVTVIASPGLRPLFADAIELPGETLRRAAADVLVLSPVQTGGISRKSVCWAVIAALLIAGGYWAWANREWILIRFGWIEQEMERPRVRVAVETERFLGYCRDELARREMWMAGFERVAVRCHSSYAPDDGISPPKELKDRPVLEVRWRLRERLPPRVYGRLAEQLLERWYWAGVNDEGQAAAVSPLPPVLARMKKRKREEPLAFRARIDGMFPLRGFAVEYRWGKQNEVTLATARPFAQAVAMIGGLPGVEVLSAAYENGMWRFEGRRLRPRSMFEARFMKLSKPLVATRIVGGKAA